MKNINFSKLNQYYNGRLDDFSFKDQSFRLIFILGLPRSGTTLTENILSSHSQVYAMGNSTECKT